MSKQINKQGIITSSSINSVCKFNSVILVDDVTGHEWILKVSNGELIIEPTEISDIRDCKINKILK